MWQPLGNREVAVRLRVDEAGGGGFETSIAKTIKIFTGQNS